MTKVGLSAGRVLSQAEAALMLGPSRGRLKQHELVQRQGRLCRPQRRQVNT